MEQGPDKNARVPLRITAPLTGILVFVSLLILDAWNIAPHSSLRAAIVGGASSLGRIDIQRNHIMAAARCTKPVK
ncbi:MAG TPA: hypothetical protein H9899_11685 [Candidatus Sphingomonas excrementigallinarum]|nr:hypothetical protein [Candidatus Sphingomonas excrementigallinarum]